MFVSSLHATTRRSDAALGCALGEMPVGPGAASSLHAVGNVGVNAGRNAWGLAGAPCTHTATKPGYINPIGDGIRLPRGTG